MVFFLIQVLFRGKSKNIYCTETLKCLRLFLYKVGVRKSNEYGLHLVKTKIDGYLT